MLYEVITIAAANALSDIYAMGGRPLTVMNLVGFPRCLEHELFVITSYSIHYTKLYDIGLDAAVEVLAVGKDHHELRLLGREVAHQVDPG